MTRTKLFATTLTLIMVGCSELPTGPGNGGGDFSVTVSSGTQPTYSWSAGPAFDVQVIRVNEPSIFAWRIVDATDPNIQSPVQHGSQPPGTNRIGAAELTLTPGVLYRVTVTLADGQTRGFREFRP